MAAVSAREYSQMSFNTLHTSSSRDAHPARPKTAIGIEKQPGPDPPYALFPPGTQPMKVVPRKPLLNSYERELLFKFYRSRYSFARRRAQETSETQNRPRANATDAAVQTRQPVKVFKIPGEFKTIEVPIAQNNEPQPFDITVTGQRAKLFEPLRHLRVKQASRKQSAAEPCDACSDCREAHVNLNRPLTAPPALKGDMAEETAPKLPVRPKSAIPASAKPSALANADSAASPYAHAHFRARRAKSATTLRTTTPGDAQEAMTIRMPKDYDEAVKQFGWRFEAHNDPLGVKRHYLAKRLSYALPFGEPNVLPLEPKATFTNHDTFFQSTVSPVRYSFTIAPDFSSEVYNRKREEMQKKGTWNYRHKDFSFLY